MRIFIDADGVLADFVGGAARLCGVPTGTTPIDRANPKQQPYDMDKKLGVKNVWDKVEQAGQGFWEDLPPCPWAKDLMAYARSKGQVTILTNQGNLRIGRFSCPGKLMWMWKHFRIDAKDVQFAREKWLLANPGRVLIDDMNENCADWESPPDESCGGRSIMVPQPWNMQWHQTHLDVMDLVKEQL